MRMHILQTEQWWARCESKSAWRKRTRSSVSFLDAVAFPSGSGSEVEERLKEEERVLEMWSLGPKRGQAGRGTTREEERN